MKIKRIFAVVLALALFSLCALSVSAAGGKISGENKTVSAGETFDYAVNIEGNLGIAGYLIYVECDTLVFSVDYDKKAEMYKAERGSFSKDGSVFCNVHNDTGWQVLWFNYEDCEGNGSLFTLHMTASANAMPGTYPVKVSYSARNLVNAAGDLIEMQCAEGSITIKDNDSGNTPDNNGNSNNDKKPKDSIGDTKQNNVFTGENGPRNIALVFVSALMIAMVCYVSIMRKKASKNQTPQK